MRESRSHGSARGAAGNRCPYRDRLVEEFAFRLRVGLRRGLPCGLLQLLDQAPGLARYDDELTTRFLVGLDRFPAIEAGIGPSKNVLHASGQSLEGALEVRDNLFARGPIAMAQPAHLVFARLGEEG